MSCRLCSREAAKNETGLCRYHEEANKNLEEGFEKWSNAYDKLDCKEYLQKVAERPEAGVWVKECCEHLLKKEIEFIQKGFK